MRMPLKMQKLKENLGQVPWLKLFKILIIISFLVPIIGIVGSALYDMHHIAGLIFIFFGAILLVGAIIALLR